METRLQCGSAPTHVGVHEDVGVHMNVGVHGDVSVLRDLGVHRNVSVHGDLGMHGRYGCAQEDVGEEVAPNTQCKPPLVQREALSSYFVPCSLGKEAPSRSPVPPQKPRGGGCAQRDPQHHLPPWDTGPGTHCSQGKEILKIKPESEELKNCN